MKARNYRVLPLLFVLISMLIVTAMPAQAASVDLRGVMDAHAYQNTAISETAFLPYRVYLPDAIAAAFPKSADNVIEDEAPVDEDAEPVGDGAAAEEPQPEPPAIEIPRDREYGLLIWLHDEDLCGDDNVSHISNDAKNGLINAFLTTGTYAADYIILAPQCPKGKTWTDNDNLYLRLLIDLVQNHIMQLPIDENRILIGGISMGATAGYELIEMQTNSGMFPISAAYLVAGTTDIKIGSDTEAGMMFEKTKVYAFLSENDTVTPPDSVRALADDVNTRFDFVQDFTYAVYPELGHEIWHQAFAEQALMDAFLATNAPAPEVTPAPIETEAVTEETDAPAIDDPIATAPVETDVVTDEVQTPPTIAGVEITSEMIAYVIMAAACILSVILLIAGLVKNNKVR